MHQTTFHLRNQVSVPLVSLESNFVSVLQLANLSSADGDI